MNEVINLRKGETINLRKQQAAVSRFLIGMSWETSKYTGQEDFDLDLSAPQLDSNGHVLRPDAVRYICGYLSAQTPDGSLTYSGDERSGKTDNCEDKYEETLTFEPAKAEDRCHKIPVVVTIDEWQDRKQTFGMVTNAFVEICNADTGEILYHYDLSEDFSVQTGVNVLEFSRSRSNPNDWLVKPVGEGFDKGLDGFLVMWGLAATRQ